MGPKTALLAGLLLLAAASARVTAAPFVNLDFEQATVPPGTGATIAASSAFPGWTPRIGTSVQSSVNYNYPGIGESAVVLYDDWILGATAVLDGQYSALLIPTQASNSASLAQSGDVPGDTKSLLIRGAQNRPAPVVTLNGTPIALVVVDPSSTIFEPVVYGGDIAAFAGETAEMRISSGASILAADSIVFSPTAVPEPSVGLWAALLLVAGGAGRSGNHDVPGRGGDGAAAVSPNRKELLSGAEDA